MSPEVAIVGLGQLGRLFGAGFLALGRTVVPIRRGETLPARAFELVLVAVGEDDLGPALASIPSALRDRVALLQNELAAPDWTAHGIVRPTVAVVWSEKKAGRPLAVVRETEVAGPHAALVVSALAAADVPARAIAEGRELEDALAVKNLYILVSNLAGLAGAATTGSLLADRRALADSIAEEVLAIESARIGRPLDRALLDRMRDAFVADPAHGCRGRTAPARLARTLRRAAEAGLEVRVLRGLPAA